MRNRSHTTTLCENDHGQTAVKPVKRWPNQDERFGRFRCAFGGTGKESFINYIIYKQLGHLKLTIDQKRPELPNRRGVVFHQDNARPHRSMVSRQ